VSRWYRAYEGTVTDEKIIEAALIADVTRSVTIAAWHCVLESASKVGNCGSFDTSPRRIAAILGEPTDKISGLFDAFSELGMVTNGAVASWKKRQYHSDDSKERVRKHREKKRAETVADKDVTPCNGDVTPPETDTDTERKKLSSYDDTASDDAVTLLPEHVVEVYNETAKSIGRPQIRDLTPERRQLTRARIAQYPLEDFQTVFARCRGSPFLRGDKGRTPLTFDWIMKKGNFQKVLEGNYDD
jgi:hypothetical protein